MKTVTSQSLDAVKDALNEALEAAQSSGDVGVVSAVVSANAMVASATVEATKRELALQAEAERTGHYVVPKYSAPLESKETLKARLSAAEKKLSESERVKNALSKDLEEQKDQIFLTGGSFWFRRFHSSLAIASAAAFLAIGNHAFDHETSKNAVRASVYPLAFFAIALGCSGLVPAAFALKKQKGGWLLSIAAVVFFSLALISAVAGAVSIGGLPWPARETPTPAAASAHTARPDRPDRAPA